MTSTRRAAQPGVTRRVCLIVAGLTLLPLGGCSERGVARSIVYAPQSCGDGQCDDVEDCDVCPVDCGPCLPRCNDGVCDADEDCDSCAEDCGECPSVCGDSMCASGETCLNDACVPEPYCGDRKCNGGETPRTCPLDCTTSGCPEDWEPLLTVRFANADNPWWQEVDKPTDVTVLHMYVDDGRSPRPLSHLGCEDTRCSWNEDLPLGRHTVVLVAERHDGATRVTQAYTWGREGDTLPLESCSPCGNGVLDEGEECDSGPCCDDSCMAMIPGSPCHDDDPCTYGQTCDATRECTGGQTTICDDHDACTNDICDGNGGCFFEPTLCVSAWRYVAYGDTRSDPGRHSRTCDLLASLEPQVVLHAGDLWDGYSSSEFRAHLETIPDVLDANLFLVARGNHESEGEVLGFTPPLVRNSSLVYSVLHNNVFFISLGEDPGSNAGYLESQLQTQEAQSADWTIVWAHRPIYSGGSHGASGDATVEGIFDTYGVTAFFAGHDHHYERTHLMYDGEIVDTDTSFTDGEGTLYYVTGGGGVDTRGVDTGLWWQAYADSIHHVVDVVVNADSMVLTTRRLNGTLVEEVTFTK